MIRSIYALSKSKRLINELHTNGRLLNKEGRYFTNIDSNRDTINSYRDSNTINKTKTNNKIVKNSDNSLINKLNESIELSSKNFKPSSIYYKKYINYILLLKSDNFDDIVINLNYVTDLIELTNEINRILKYIINNSLTNDKHLKLIDQLIKLYTNLLIKSSYEFSSVSTVTDIKSITSFFWLLTSYINHKDIKLNNIIGKKCLDLFEKIYTKTSLISDLEETLYLGLIINYKFINIDKDTNTSFRLNSLLSEVHFKFSSYSKSESTLTNFFIQLKKSKNTNLIISFINFLSESLKFDQIDIFSNLFNAYGPSISTLDLDNLNLNTSSHLKFLIIYNSILISSSTEKISLLLKHITFINFEINDSRLLPFTVYLKDSSLNLFYASSVSDEELVKFNSFFKYLYPKSIIELTVDLKFEIESVELLRNDQFSLFEDKFLTAYKNSSNSKLFFGALGYLFTTYMFASIKHSSFLEYNRFCLKLNSHAPIFLNYFIKADCTFVTGLLIGKSFYNTLNDDPNLKSCFYFHLASLIYNTSFHNIVKSYKSSTSIATHTLVCGSFLSIVFNDFDNFANLALTNGNINLSEHLSNSNPSGLPDFNNKFTCYIREITKINIKDSEYYDDYLSFIYFDQYSTLNMDSINKALDTLKNYLVDTSKFSLEEFDHIRNYLHQLLRFCSNLTYQLDTLHLNKILVLCLILNPSATILVEFFKSNLYILGSTIYALSKSQFFDDTMNYSYFNILISWMCSTKENVSLEADVANLSRLRFNIRDNFMKSLISSDENDTKINVNFVDISNLRRTIMIISLYNSYDLNFIKDKNYLLSESIFQGDYTFSFHFLQGEDTNFLNTSLLFSKFSRSWLMNVKSVKDTVLTFYSKSQYYLGFKNGNFDKHLYFGKNFHLTTFSIFHSLLNEFDSKSLISKFLPLPDEYFKNDFAFASKIVLLSISSYAEQNMWEDALESIAKLLRLNGKKYKHFEIQQCLSCLVSFNNTSSNILPTSLNLFLLEYLRASMGLNDSSSSLTPGIFRDISPNNYIKISKCADEILTLVNSGVKKCDDKLLPYRIYRRIMGKLAHQYKLSMNYNNNSIKKLSISTMNQLISDLGYLVTSFVLDSSKNGFSAFRVKNVNTDDLTILLETKSENYRVLSNVLTMNTILNPLLTIVETTNSGIIGVIDFHFLFCPDTLFLMFQFQMKKIIVRIKNGNLEFSTLKLICGRGQHSLITGYAPIRLMILRLLIKIGLLEYCNADPYQTLSERHGLKVESPFMLEILSIEKKDLIAWYKQVSDPKSEFYKACKDLELDI